MSALATNGASTKTTLDTGPTLAYETEKPSYRGEGWVVFAAIMFVIAACLNVIWGIAAVSSSHFFVANTQFIIISSLHTWGWIVMAIGALEALTALLIWRRGAFGRWLGIGLAGLGVVAAMMSIPAYPVWSLVLVAFYALVIYGLAVYGGTPAATG